MPWVRIDDQFADHPKILQAGPLASWLFVCGLTYCSRLLTDGFIPVGQVRRLADVKDPLALAEKLVAAGLWDVVDGGYLVHDYLEYNPAAEKVKAQRRKTAERQARWRDEQQRNDQSNGVTNEHRNAVTNASTNGHVTHAPYPTRTHTPVLEPLGLDESCDAVGDAPAAEAQSPAAEELELSPVERRIISSIKQVRGMANVPDRDVALHLRETLAIRGSPFPDDVLLFEFTKFRDVWHARRSTQPDNRRWTQWRRAVTEWVSRIKHEPAGSEPAYLQYPDWTHGDPRE